MPPRKKAAAPEPKPESTETPAEEQSEEQPEEKKVVTASGSAEVGDIVQVTVDPRSNNGSDVAPAVVTRVLDSSDSRVNLKVFLDGDTVQSIQNVTLHDSRPEDDEEVENGKVVGGKSQVAFTS